MGTDPSLVSFGRAVRALRESQNLSQEALADATGLHRTYIGGIERAERNPSLMNIIRLARALGVPASQLLVRAEQYDLSRGTANRLN
ncbi:helix-turn-helix domain-containing protein [Spiribacter roseus]|uniref:helix-turn-helix domain-containing protein n=1 Tax=Spiribacter roseus TaxID=1855875 RepID=UPI001330BB77|nr:helix-turn-helix transcriptional regulator [Spiribacter roseus]